MAKQTYTPIAKDEHEADQLKPRPPKSWLPIYIGSALICTSLIIAFIFFFSTMPGTDLQFDHCGNSSDEARSRGCKFDVLSFAWQIPQCFDEENTEAFLAHKNWTWYTEYHGTEQRTEAEVRSGNYSAFVSAEYHFYHCTYMYRSLHRAYAVGGYVDDHLDNYNHTKHCQQYLLYSIEPGFNMTENNVLGGLKYPKCRKVK